MTGYVVEEEIRRGRLGVEVQISVNAWRTGGSKMFIREGTNVAVSELLKESSFNRAMTPASLLAEHIAGNEDQFADLMNQQARFLNMNDTQFRNSTGLPSEQHYSTAWDMALLTTALIKITRSITRCIRKKAIPITTSNSQIVIGCCGEIAP